MNGNALPASDLPSMSVSTRLACPRNLLGESECRVQLPRAAAHATATRPRPRDRLLHVVGPQCPQIWTRPGEQDIWPGESMQTNVVNVHAPLHEPLDEGQARHDSKSPLADMNQGPRTNSGAAPAASMRPRAFAGRSVCTQSPPRNLPHSRFCIDEQLAASDASPMIASRFFNEGQRNCRKTPAILLPSARLGNIVATLRGEGW